jgi:hypothetical protein
MRGPKHWCFKIVARPDRGFVQYLPSEFKAKEPQAMAYSKLPIMVSAVHATEDAAAKRPCEYSVAAVYLQTKYHVAWGAGQIRGCGLRFRMEQFPGPSFSAD